MARVAKPKQTYPPDWATYQWPDMTILAFDQSLANTGWCVLRTTSHGKPRVLLYGTVTTEPDETLTGWRDSLARGDALVEEFDRLLSVVRGNYHLDAIVHEMPAMMGGTRSTKQEGPPIAAMAVRAAVRRHQRVEFHTIPLAMVEIQKWKKWITGNHLADKPEIARAVWEIVPLFHTNEHVRDAIGVGLGAICAGKIVLDSELESM